MLTILIKKNNLKYVEAVNGFIYYDEEIFFA